MKWSVHSEKEKFTREAASKHKVTLKLIGNYLKNIKVKKSFRYMKHKENWQNVIQYLAISNSCAVFEDTVVVLALAFSILNSPVQPRNSRFVT